MRILQVIPTLGNGGAEHFVCELSNELCRQGHCVDILTLYAVPVNNQLRELLDSRISIHSMSKKIGFDPFLFFNLWTFIKTKSYDVVHGHVGAILYLSLASFFCRKSRFIATIHSDASFEAGSYIHKWSRKIMFTMNTCIPVTISEESEKSFEEFYGKKTVMIVNGVSPYNKRGMVTLRDNEHQTVFLHVASCQPVKNQILLFEAFNKLLDRGFDAKIVWIGNISIYQSLFESLKPLMKRNVTILGERANVRDFMMAADAVCLSSKMEGMPMTIIEAFSVGSPVLCTPVGGCVNMINDGENGMVSKDLTVESYYRMLESFVKLNKEEKGKLSSGSLDSFKYYSIKNCAQRYLRIYR